jgi:hypothetical protein
MFAILVCCSLAYSQSKPKPNISGKWIVDFARSEKTNNSMEDAEQSVTIQQNDPEIRMVRQFNSVPAPFVVFSDERGESYKSPVTGVSIKSKTKWDGDKLVIHYLGGSLTVFGMRDINVIEEFKLAKDGNTLTKKIIVIPPRNAPNRVNAVPVSQSNLEFKKVYNRAPN